MLKHHLIHANINFLKSALELLAKLDLDQYTEQPFGERKSSIGSHLRHVIDHYYCFLRGLLGQRQLKLPINDN